MQIFVQPGMAQFPFIFDHRHSFPHGLAASADLLLGARPVVML
jgi:hypothetical protein